MIIIPSDAANTLWEDVWTKKTSKMQCQMFWAVGHSDYYVYHMCFASFYILLFWIIVYIYAIDATYSDMYIYTFNMISCLSTYTILKTRGHFYILYLLLSGHSGDVWLSLRRAPVSWPRSSAEHLGFHGETMRILVPFYHEMQGFHGSIHNWCNCEMLRPESRIWLKQLV